MVSPSRMAKVKKAVFTYTLAGIPKEIFEIPNYKVYDISMFNHVLKVKFENLLYGTIFKIM